MKLNKFISGSYSYEASYFQFESLHAGRVILFQNVAMVEADFCI